MSRVYVTIVLFVSTSFWNCVYMIASTITEREREREEEGGEEGGEEERWLSSE
jgi:phage shock protein PspC (stress-responsive transcriptional regulator)